MERNPEASSSKGKKKKKTEEASLMKGNKKTEEQSEKGNFYRFKERDVMVPEFLNATKLNIEAGYRKSPIPGGRDAIRHMFRAFSRYQDGTVTDEELETACYCFMGTVSEPSRLFSFFLEISRRIAAGEVPSPLNNLLLSNIDNWGQLGNVVLDARLLDRLGSYRLLPLWCWRHNLVIMRELIGQRGKILVIRIDRKKIGISEERLKEIEKEAASRNTGLAYRLDPGFELVAID